MKKGGEKVSFYDSRCHFFFLKIAKSILVFSPCQTSHVQSPSDTAGCGGRGLRTSAAGLEQNRKQSCKFLEESEDEGEKTLGDEMSRDKNWKRKSGYYLRWSLKGHHRAFEWRQQQEILSARSCISYFEEGSPRGQVSPCKAPAR